MSDKEYITVDSRYDENFKIPLTFMDKINNLPKEPGVYLHKNKTDKVIYVGKAKNLRARVRSYFKDLVHKDPKSLALIKNIYDTEYIIVDSEAEAFILEDTLIKKYRPRYNVMLKDDKTYPYVRITNEEFPQVFSTRKVIRDGSKYYGPYTEGRHIKQLLKTIRDIYQMRTCKLNLKEKTIESKKFKVCLNYHIQKCDAPCVGYTNREDYLEKIKQIQKILSGRTREVKQKMTEQMSDLSEALRFEEAAIIRNRIISLEDYSNKQKVVTTELVDRDIFGYAIDGNIACTTVMKVREGKLIGKRNFIVNNVDKIPISDIIQRTVESWYLDNDFIPREIFLPEEHTDLEYLSDWLGKKLGKSISIYIPKIGDKKKIVEMSNTNSDWNLKEYLLAIAKRDQALPHPVQALQRDLRLSKPPRRIECFDNSHIQGSDLVSSMVVFVNGKASKADYRKYKIRTVEKNDDFAAMRETIQRRYSKLIAENQEFPDLIIVDGGKGQLSSAVEILTELGIIDKVTIIGLAKRLEEVFFPGISEAIQIPKTSSGLKLIQQVRDEAHRFAITFHRELRSKRTIRTELTEIKGIGENISQKLLKHFGSVEGIKNSKIDDIEKLIGKSYTDKIINYFSL